MTTDSHSECMVCKNDVTNIEYSNRKKEKYFINKYLFPFIIKKCLFIVLCIIAVVAMLILSMPNIDWYIWVCSFLLLIDSFTSSFYPAGKANQLSGVYSDSFLDTHFGIHKYITGAASVLIAFLYLIIRKL